MTRCIISSMVNMSDASFKRHLHIEGSMALTP